MAIVININIHRMIGRQVFNQESGRMVVEVDIIITTNCPQDFINIFNEQELNKLLKIQLQDENYESADLINKRIGEIK